MLISEALSLVGQNLFMIPLKCYKLCQKYKKIFTTRSLVKCLMSRMTTYIIVTASKDTKVYLHYNFFEVSFLQSYCLNKKTFYRLIFKKLTHIMLVKNSNC